MIKLNDLQRELAYLEAPLLAATENVVRSGWYLNGAATQSFCREFAGYLGIRHVIAVANGTDALELALRAIGVSAGHEVIVAANAGGYGTTAVRLLDAMPVYADISIPSMTLDPASVAEMLSAKTRAVVVTHLYGNHADVTGIREALRASGRGDIVVIEDCAQAHGARSHGRMAGTHGDVACFSFYPTKNLGALGDAGAVATGDETLAARLRLLHQYGWESRYRTTVAGGRNSRMDEIQAAFLSVKLTKLDELNARRRRVLERYRHALSSRYTLCALSGEESVGHLAVLLCPDREAAAAYLKERGVETGIHYPILDCDQPAWQALPSRKSALSESRRAVEGILTVPCYPHLRDNELEDICAALASLP